MWRSSGAGMERSETRAVAEAEGPKVTKHRQFVMCSWALLHFFENIVYDHIVYF
jgi:hypothetical protein